MTGCEAGTNGGVRGREAAAALAVALAWGKMRRMTTDISTTPDLPGADLRRDRAAERRAWLMACQIAWVTLATYLVIASLSIETELERDGDIAPPLFAWALEGSSVIVTALIVPGIMWLGLKAPLEPGRWLTSVPVHIGGFFVYLALHLVGMVLLREAIWIVFYGGEYEFFYGRPLREIVYEMRKDMGTYLGYQIIVAISRAMQQYRLEAEAARREARSGHRLTLKCGGRTLMLDAATFHSARAAGNYVEVRAGTGEHLARMTLAELERQLREAGVEAVRVHRSWLVNRDRIAEIVPTGEGDVTLTLTNGEQVPGSRRYRDRLDVA